jgi:beta-galactosidase/beta-glucuronidase
VQSAVEGGFNTFRLWGGGIFQWDAWYDACDELGVLIYHDVSEKGAQGDRCHSTSVLLSPATHTPSQAPHATARPPPPPSCR